jgi:oligopeptide/dipeptide ABC transporter ATP-binding protein
VRIADAARRLAQYPHELSGGMRQRAMIAMALALRPKLLIADEPTTALDATVQAQLMELLTGMQRELGMAVIIITHDLGLVASIADSVLVMYAGRAAERADSRTIFYSPHHPYTRGLLGSIPGATGVHGRLVPIVGQPPSLIRIPTGCAFHPRCPFAMDACVRDQPDLAPVSGGVDHLSACFLPPDAVGVDPAMDATRRHYAESRRGVRVARLQGVTGPQGGGGVADA